MKKVTAMLFSMAVGLNAVSMAAKAKATEEQETDVLLIGGGIMSATLGTYLQELEPDWSMTMVERPRRCRAREFKRLEQCRNRALCADGVELHTKESRREYQYRKGSRN